MVDLITGAVITLLSILVGWGLGSASSAKSDGDRNG